MKKITTVLLILVFLLALSGCGTARAVQKLDAAEDRLEEKLDAVEDRVESKVEDSLRGDAASAPAGEFQPAAPEQAQLLTKEQAQQIALDYLETAADQVTGLRAEYEIDDGIPQYDVQFNHGDWEYEFEIHGETGKILSYDKEHRYD